MSVVLDCTAKYSFSICLLINLLPVWENPLSQAWPRSFYHEIVELESFASVSMMQLSPKLALIVFLLSWWIVTSFILDFLKSKRSVLQEKITNMQVRFLNLLRDGSITSGKLSNKINRDLPNLLQLVEKETATAGDKNL